MRLTDARLDLNLGIMVYTTDTGGLGGRIRQVFEDFVVEEVGEDGVACTNTSPTRFVEGTGRFVFFVLEKRGIDTASAVRLMARELGVSVKAFSYSSRKDAGAVTFQWMCAEGIPEYQLLSFKDHSGRIKISAVSRRPFKLFPGMLYGNRFTITVRSINSSPSSILDEVKEASSQIRCYGVPAYYGYQRFGTVRPNTHVVGRCLLKGGFEEAVMELLGNPRPLEAEEVREARRYAVERDFPKSLSLFSPSFTYERAVLHHLSRYSNDFEGAVLRMPSILKRLFVDAYRAYLFNLTLSERILEKLPTNAVVDGDLIAESRRGDVIQVDGNNLDEADELVRGGKAMLVLNLFGFASKIGEGRQGEIERGILETESLRLEDFRKGVFRLGLKPISGSYRPAIFRPEGFRVRCVGSDEINAGFSSLVLDFTLRRGMYATILLREFMKPKDVVKAGY